MSSLRFPPEGVGYQAGAALLTAAVGALLWLAASSFERVDFRHVFAVLLVFSIALLVAPGWRAAGRRGPAAEVEPSQRDTRLSEQPAAARHSDSRDDGSGTILREISDEGAHGAQVLPSQGIELTENLAGGSSHDLNNLMLPVSMALEHLRDRVGEDDREILNIAEASTRRATSVIRELLLFARSGAVERADLNVDDLAASSMDPPGEKETPVPIKPLPGAGQQVLVVDDERAILKMCVHILKRAGYIPVTAGDGEAAVDLFRDRHGEIGVSIIDMSMPVMDGPATIRALRRIDPRCRVIAVSGLSEKEDVALEAGGGRVQFVRKPFSAESLLAALQAEFEQG